MKVWLRLLVTSFSRYWDRACVAGEMESGVVGVEAGPAPEEPVIPELVRTVADESLVAKTASQD